MAWPQDRQVAISPPKVSWLFLLLALTHPLLKAVLTSALESCVVRPRPGLSGGTVVATAVRAGSPKHRDGSVPRWHPQTAPVFINARLVSPSVVHADNKVAFSVSVHWSELRLEHRRLGSLGIKSPSNSITRDQYALATPPGRCPARPCPFFPRASCFDCVLCPQRSHEGQDHRPQVLLRK